MNTLKETNRLPALARIALAAALALTLVNLRPTAMARTASIRYVSATGSSDAGDCTGAPCATIAYAVGQSVDGDVIELAAGTYTEAGIVVDEDLTIRGQGPGSTIVQAHANPNTATDRVFTIDYADDVIIQDLTVRHGNTTSEGGGIFTDFQSTLTLENVVVHDNTGNDGGGVYGNSDLTVISCTIRNNAAIMGTFGGDGGGLYNASTGALSVTDSVIADNEADGDGGGIRASKMTISDSVVSGNEAKGTNVYGGGIASIGVMTATRVTVTGNYSNDLGGGIYNSLDYAILTECTISDNVANDSGGGIVNSDTLTITHSTIYSNTAGQYGGGIYHLSDNLTLNNSLVHGNSAAKSGGGIESSDALEMNNSTISGNISNGSGGGFYAGDGNVEISSSTIVNNVADFDGDTSGWGGGIYVYNGSLYLKSTIVVNNDAAGGTSRDDCYEGSGYGYISSSGYNLYGASTGCPVSYGHDKSTTNPSAEIDLTLADNGGATLTHAILPGGQAVDGGSCTGTTGKPITQDQRGVLRPRDGNADGTASCDKGAYELYTGTGPGGVGATDGYSNLMLWLKADAGVYENASCSDAAEGDDPVACWADQSGRGNDATQAAAGNRPAYKTGVSNGRPTNRFDGATDLLATSAFTSDLSQPNTALLAAQFGGDGQAAIDGLDAGHRQQIAQSAGQYALNAGGTPIAGGAADAAFHVLAGTFDAGASALHADGALAATGNPGSHAMNGATLGAAGGGGSYLAGDVAEAIVYSATLNSAQRTLVENYLSSKYAIALDTGGGAKDVYAGDEAGKGDYDTDVAGIGKEADGLNPDAHSAGLILINNPFLTDDGDYVVMGHDGTANGTTTSEVSGDAVLRWTRAWYLDRTDGGGSANGDLKLAFDFGEGGLSDEVGDLETYTFALLYRSATSGAFAIVTVVSTSIVDDKVVFEVADGELQDGYYTLGYKLGTVITVTTDEDELNSDGDCSLREAIQAAHTNADVDLCPAGSPINPDTIVVPTGVYTLTRTGAGENNNATGDLDIRSDMNIRGAGSANTTINGNHIDRVLEIPIAGPTVTIDDLTITNGRTGQGGGIRNVGTLTLNNVVVTGNTASTSDGGGIHNYGGTLTLNDCTVSDNTASGDGGGISNYGGATTTLNRCTVSGNSATAGGGLHNDYYAGSGINRLTLNNSTVSGNWATGHGGGIYTGIGSGYLLHDLVLLNCTITNNTADSNDNDSGDGGGVYNDRGSTDVRNTIIAGNYDLSDGTSHPDWSLNLRSEGYTLLGNTAGTVLSQVAPSTDILGADPALGALAENGGDTQTHALSVGSPARDAVPIAQCTLTTDQRGVARPQRNACDIGAYERENEAPDAVDDIAFAAINTPATISVLSNDTDPEGDTLSVIGVGSPITGTAGIASSTTVVYTPTLGFQGTDVFTYTVSDGYGGADVATVTVSVGDAEFVYLPLVLKNH